MKLGIVGSRKFNNFSAIIEAADKLRPTSIVSGGAAGADALAKKYASMRGIPIVEFLPDLEKYGSPAAFHIRNRQIAELSDAIIACMDAPSAGTESTIKAARKLGKPVQIIGNHQQANTGNLPL